MSDRRAGGAPLGVPEPSLTGRLRGCLRRPADGDDLATVALQAMAGAVAVADPDGVLVMVNPACERLAGRPSTELLGRSWCGLDGLVAYPEKDGAALLARLRAGEPRAVLLTEWLREEDGARREVEWELTAVRDDSGLRYLVAAGTDVTERRHNERQAERLLADVEGRSRELERLNDELEQFASIAAHDLREPLRAITGFGDLLRRHAESGLDERGLEFLRRIEQAANRMNALLDALSSYGRAARPEAPVQDVEVAEVLDGVLESLGPQIAEREAEVTRGPLPRLVTDPVALGRVLQNLVVNAVKFNEGRPPRVHVSAEPRDGGWELVVRDNGIGVPIKERERIFQMFRRLHSRDAYPGTGAGLAIVHRIVERLGGRVWVEPSPEGGSEFHVLLPAEPGA